MAHRALAFAFFASTTAPVQATSPTEADPPPTSGIRCVEYEGFPHAEEAGAPISLDERMAFVRQRDRLAIALELALKTWFGRLKRPADAFKIAQSFYESGDSPDASFAEMQKLPEFRRFLVTEGLEALSELRSDGSIHLTLLGTSAWTSVHAAFMSGKGIFAGATERRGFTPTAS